MRTSLTLLGGLFVLLFSFSSCIEESSDTVLTPGPETNLEASEGTMTYRGIESPIVAVYDPNGVAAEMGTTGTADYATIILSNADMMGANNRLTQTGDVIIVNIVKEGSLAGTYAPNDWSEQNNVQFFANICTGMNFATGRMDDDEGIESGETIITDNDDGTYTIDFELVTYDRNFINGSWTGALTPTVD